MKNNLEETFIAEAVPYLNDLYRTAVRLTRRRTEAEDIVQEVFLQALKSFDRYEAGTNCRAWLFKILFFKIKHYRRRFFAESNFFQSNVEENTIYAGAIFKPSISEHLTDREVIAAVDRLPARYREVALLADVHEFAYKEIAEILDVPIGTVMSRLSRARKQLRESLSGAAREYGIKISAPAFGETANCVI